MRAPEIVTDGFPKRRARWSEIATSADHKDVGRILIVSSLGFLFLGLIELLLMRLQLAIPENTFLSPVAFNRMLSMYGATTVFFFLVPFFVGFFHYLAPLQIGARWTALPRVSQLGAWLVIAGATVLYAGFLFTPSEAGVNPLPPLSELAFTANDGVDAWTSATGLATLGFVLIAIDLTTTLRRMRAPGDGLAPPPRLRLGGGDRLLAAARDRPDLPRGADDARDRPQLRRRLLRRRLRRRAAALAAPELDLLQRRLRPGPDRARSARSPKSSAPSPANRSSTAPR